MKKVSTTKSRLMGFFVLVAGTSLLISMFTMIFSMVYNYRYQDAIEQMTIFNEYYENLDDTMAAMKRYTMYEEKEEYQTVKGYMGTVKECLEDLSKRTEDMPFFREIQDITEMTDYLENKIDLVYKDMERYHEEGKATFSFVSQKYNEVNEIYEAINEEYRVMNCMILGYIDEMYLGMQKRSKIFMGCFLILFMGMFGILFLQIRNISHSISKPIQRLTQEAQHIREGDLEQVAKLPTDDLADQDLKMLTEVFNDMVMGLRRQIEMMRENERVHKELEASRFKELQMQINPHFMFNTLNMISDTAYLEGAEKTVYLLDRTAKMFRFSLDFSGKEITLFREIEELGNYVYVQEQRFGERIRFLFELDESFHQIKIPSFILQPLVENAITHGVGMMRRKAQILIKTMYDNEEDTAILVVEDDGMGMDREKVEKVQREMEEYSGKNMKIGLGNVYLRMKMFFGDRVCMRIQSEKEKGTRVTIQIRDALKGE
ncbi:MAG: histidine kinase [Lachnospiraceae bacterium]|nr:histidine kinase [Robinsoniella sp.]MDY3765699.1 histidine kinase [Lachnospiraceae bacterium]